MPWESVKKYEWQREVKVLWDCHNDEQSDGHDDASNDVEGLEHQPGEEEADPLLRVKVVQFLTG